MKTEVIKQSIISQFKTLSKKAKVVPEKEHIVPTWGLSYKNNGVRGFVNQFGSIERNGAKIDIVDGEIKQIKKPFYMSWKKTLGNINTMLGKIEENIDNKNVVKKNVVSFVCFPKEFVEKLEKTLPDRH